MLIPNTALLLFQLVWIVRGQTLDSDDHSEEGGFRVLEEGTQGEIQQSQSIVFLKSFKNLKAKAHAATTFSGERPIEFLRYPLANNEGHDLHESYRKPLDRLTDHQLKTLLSRYHETEINVETMTRDEMLKTLESIIDHHNQRLLKPKLLTNVNVLTPSELTINNDPLVGGKQQSRTTLGPMITTNIPVLIDNEDDSLVSGNLETITQPLNKQLLATTPQTLVASDDYIDMSVAEKTSVADNEANGDVSVLGASAEQSRTTMATPSQSSFTTLSTNDATIEPIVDGSAGDALAESQQNKESETNTNAQLTPESHAQAKLTSESNDEAKSSPESSTESAKTLSTLFQSTETPKEPTKKPAFTMMIRKHKTVPEKKVNLDDNGNFAIHDNLSTKSKNSRLHSQFIEDLGEKLKRMKTKYESMKIEFMRRLRRINERHMSTIDKPNKEDLPPVRNVAAAAPTIVATGAKHENFNEERAKTLLSEAHNAQYDQYAQPPKEIEAELHGYNPLRVVPFDQEHKGNNDRVHHKSQGYSDDNVQHHGIDSIHHQNHELNKQDQSKNQHYQELTSEAKKDNKETITYASNLKHQEQQETTTTEKDEDKGGEENEQEKKNIQAFFNSESSSSERKPDSAQIEVLPADETSTEASRKSTMFVVEEEIRSVVDQIDSLGQRQAEKQGQKHVINQGTDGRNHFEMTTVMNEVTMFPRIINGNGKIMPEETYAKNTEVSIGSTAQKTSTSSSSNSGSPSSNSSPSNSHSASFAPIDSSSMLDSDNDSRYNKPFIFPQQGLRGYRERNSNVKRIYTSGYTSLNSGNSNGVKKDAKLDVKKAETEVQKTRYDTQSTKIEAQKESLINLKQEQHRPGLIDSDYDLVQSHSSFASDIQRSPSNDVPTSRSQKQISVQQRAVPQYQSPVALHEAVIAPKDKASVQENSESPMSSMIDALKTFENELTSQDAWVEANRRSSTEDKGDISAIELLQQLQKEHMQEHKRQPDWHHHYPPQVHRDHNTPFNEADDRLKQCQSIACDFENQDLCNWETTEDKVSPGSYNYRYLLHKRAHRQADYVQRGWQNWRGRYRNSVTGIARGDTFNEQNQRFAASYVKPHQRSTLTAIINATRDETIEFQAWEAARNIQLRVCCDSVENCVFETEIGVKRGSRKWRTFQATCPAGTQEIFFECINHGIFQGACGVDNIHLVDPACALEETGRPLLDSDGARKH
ncbi:unnamed protein product [Bursaphelenchus okinawaensis]|uniref:Uncharacterized protein n=1 Tax=Bursaphelenchus okinawaensis TaxID=465554 RepID=A0A811KVE3_9BILA|nr:unnamed protein product [Bursaphelenchus okinawaensis]CAG9113943.1 unnamed protein product [Bursaphelenchus okinawaensis]